MNRKQSRSREKSSKFNRLRGISVCSPKTKKRKFQKGFSRWTNRISRCSQPNKLLRRAKRRKQLNKSPRKMLLNVSLLFRTQVQCKILGLHKETRKYLSKTKRKTRQAAINNKKKQATPQGLQGPQRLRPPPILKPSQFQTTKTLKELSCWANAMHQKKAEKRAQARRSRSQTLRWRLK